MVPIQGNCNLDTIELHPVQSTDNEIQISLPLVDYQNAVVSGSCPLQNYENTREAAVIENSYYCDTLNHSSANEPNDSELPNWGYNFEANNEGPTRSGKTFSTCDLISWSFQITRGMKYLASKKV